MICCASSSPTSPEHLDSAACGTFEPLSIISVGLLHDHRERDSAARGRPTRPDVFGWIGYNGRYMDCCLNLPQVAVAPELQKPKSVLPVANSKVGVGDEKGNRVSVANGILTGIRAK